MVTEPGFNLLVKLVSGWREAKNYLLVFGLFAVVTAVLFPEVHV